MILTFLQSEKQAEYGETKDKLQENFQTNSIKAIVQQVMKLN